MIILDGNTQVFQAVLAGAISTDQPEFQATYGKLNADSLDSYLTNQGELNSTTDVALVTGVASRQIGIKSISVFNRDDAQVIITFKKDISATDRFLYRVVLEVNESVHYESARGWYVTDAAGIEKVTQVVEVNDLSVAVTWANIPDANVPESAVTQHEAALTITEGQITGAAFTNWNNAFGWGDHALVGYLTGETSHADVLVDGDFGSNGIMTRTGAGVYAMLTDASANWNTAFGWGDHASGGYAASAHVHEGTAIDATAVTDGYVLTADGAGNAAWEAAAGGGGGGTAWEQVTAADTIAAGEGFLVTNSGAAFDIDIAATVAANEEFIIHNATTSTGAVSIEPNTGHTIKGPFGTAVGGTDTIVIAPGETIRMVAVSSSVLEII